MATARQGEWFKTIVDLSDDSTTVNLGPTILGAIYVDVVLSAQACPIVDGSTTQFNLLASLAAGSEVTFCKGMRFETSLVVDPDNAATGTILVLWRPLYET